MRGKSFLGYKHHVNADAKNKLIRHYDVTDASAHDGQKFDGLVKPGQHIAGRVRGQCVSLSGERGEAQGATLAQSHQRGSRNHPLSKAPENANRQKSKVRARVERVFGAQRRATPSFNSIEWAQPATTRTMIVPQVVSRMFATGYAGA